MQVSKISVLVCVLLITLSVLLAGCDANSQESQSVREQQQQYVTGQPVPQFDWSLERHVMVELYKARNSAVSTYSVVYSQYRGSISFACPSIGYPIPGGTQLTNPDAYYATGAVLPQAEPNGLFSPTTSAGTYVMCVNTDGSISPVYIEENVMTFPYPVTTDANGRLVPAEGSKPSISINPNRVP